MAAIKGFLTQHIMPRLLVAAALLSASPLVLALAACGDGGGAGNANIPQGNDEGQPFDLIAPETRLYIVGNTARWRAEISAGQMAYTAQDSADAVDIDVQRFAGRGGLSFSGILQGSDLLLAISPQDCTDNASGAHYPYIATLRIDDDVQAGCAWSDAQPFTQQDPATDNQ